MDVDTAVDRFRRGKPVAIGGSGSVLVAMAAELASEDSLARFEARYGPAALLISGERAAVLKLANQSAAAGSSAVLLRRAPWHDLPQLAALADPLQDLALPLKGPLSVDRPLPEWHPRLDAALALARLARLLPAALVARGESADPLSPQLVQAADAPDRLDLRLVASATVPLADADHSRIHAFRTGDGALEHLAVEINAPPRDRPALVRVHSECLTGDLLASLKCDCGPQLRGALRRIAAEPGGGVLLYMGQEGRGIGLINKLRAYALQDQGFDTVDANLRLGFAVDTRSFQPAALMLRRLGFAAVRLLTNNPQKVAGLEAAGVRVVERVGHDMGENPHNALYRATKRDRTGHLLD